MLSTWACGSRSRWPARHWPAAKSVAEGVAGASAQLGDVFVRRPRRLRRLGDQPEIPRRRQAPLVPVKQVHPGHLLALEGADPQLDLVVEAGIGAFPVVQ